MLNLICKFTGHWWSYSEWELFALDRPTHIWKRDLRCRCCGTLVWQTTRGRVAPLNVVGR